jgi:Putative metallopeptidase
MKRFSPLTSDWQISLIFGVVLLVNVSCNRRPQSDPAPPVAPSPSGLTASARDNGDLKLVYKPRKTQKPGNTVGSNSGVLDQFVGNLNEKIALPWDLPVVFEDCDGPDAHYDPESRSLTICYQLIDEFYDLFGRKIKDKAKLDDAVRGAVASTFFHELGHALVDAWKIPITGREEDAVDQLSTLVLINNTTNGEQMALAGAVSFKLYAEQDKDFEKIYWDEHSVDEQRFYDTICLVYGHAPDKYAYLIKDGTLPEERAELCKEDYPRIVASWRQLLNPFLKQSPARQ